MWDERETVRIREGKIGLFCTSINYMMFLEIIPCKKIIKLNVCLPVHMWMHVCVHTHTVVLT